MNELGKQLAAQAAMYILGVLASEGEVPCTRFWDGTQASAKRLGRMMKMKYPVPTTLSAFQIAANALHSRGCIRLRETGRTLADGTPDFDFSLTDEGRRFIASGKKVEFLY